GEDERCDGASTRAADPAGADRDDGRSRGVRHGSGHSALIRVRRAIATSTGAPRNAVTMPASISPGDPTRRPIVSAMQSKAAPPSADSGRIARWSGPTTRRTACGTIRPTNAIGPATAVTEAHRITPAAAAIARVVPTFTPRPRARSEERRVGKGRRGRRAPCQYESAADEEGGVAPHR